jgi:hypothetical protein
VTAKILDETDAILREKGVGMRRLGVPQNNGIWSVDREWQVYILVSSLTISFQRDSPLNFFVGKTTPSTSDCRNEEQAY